MTVCTGSEWYLFPTHFFLPGTVRLEFLRDGFGGILPQHFAKENGTWCEPPQPFNDRNREEPSRYVQLERCDYLVLLLDERQGPKELGPLRSGLMRGNQGVWPRHSPGSEVGAAIEPRFTVAARRPVISPEHSLSSLGRAFFVPGLSTRTVRFRDYVLFKKQE